MPMIFARHRVADYAAWRLAYDDDVERRDAAGLREVGVYRDANDPNMVMIVFDADSTDGFMQMLGSEELRAKMEEAGVVSALETWVGQKLGQEA